MKTLQDLRYDIAAYLQVSLPELLITIQDDPLIQRDIFITAANNAKRSAQLSVDWEAELYRVYISNVANGKTNWRTANKVADDSEVQVKQPETFYIEWEDNPEYLIPIRHSSQKSAAIRAKERLDARQFVANDRYRSDEDLALSTIITQPNYSNQYELFILGDEVEFMPPPQNTLKLVMDAYLWFPDYTIDTDTDMFLDHGYAYMMWAVVVELNRIFQTFVPQEEGNLPPPVRERDAELDKLIIYNNYIIESGRQARK